MKRTALYLRVSTLDQHPETQLHDLRQLAQQRGLEIVGTYTDYLSSTKIRRPKLEHMLTDARQGKFQVVRAMPRQARTGQTRAVSQPARSLTKAYRRLQEIPDFKN